MKALMVPYSLDVANGAPREVTRATEVSLLNRERLINLAHKRP